MSVDFILPGVYTHFELNKKLIELQKQKPLYFYPDLHFSAVYGMFPFGIWNAGRIFMSYQQATREEIIEIRDYFNGNNIPIRLTWTNLLIEEKHLYDHFCNMVMELLDNGQNEVVIASPILEEYIRKKYPSFKICSSTTKTITDFDELQEELSKDYFQVCLDYNFNNKFEYLDKITEIEKCEFLCNAICVPACPHRAEHYMLNSICILNGGAPFNVDCPLRHDLNSPQAQKFSHRISYKDIQEKYLPKGFHHFKLEGRTLSDQTLKACYIDYFIKPEYQIHAIEMF